MQKIISVLFFLLILFLGKIKAQISITDSLKLELNTTKSDSLKIILLCKISDVYANFRPDTALFFALKGVTVAQESGSLKGESRCLTRIGNIYKTIGNYPKSLETHLTALKISETIDDQTGIGASFNNMAEVYKEQGDYPKALIDYAMTNAVFQKIILTLEKDKSTINSEQIQNKIKTNKKFLGITNLNIGDTYERMGILDSALFYQTKAFDIASKNGDDDIIGAIYCNLGAVYSRMGKTNEAINNFKQSIYYLELEDDKQFQSITYTGLSELFLKKSLTDSALKYAYKSLLVAKEGDFQKEIFNAAKLLSEIYEKNKKTDSAFVYQKLATIVKDSMFNQEKVRKVESIKFSEQIRQQEIVLNKEKEAKERSDKLQYIAISIFIITFFVALILIRRKKTKAKLIEYFGLVALLLLFEFIALFLHPYIGSWTHHTPIYMLLILVGMAAILSPLHHKLSHWIKHKLAQKHIEYHPTETEVPIASLIESNISPPSSEDDNSLIPKNKSSEKGNHKKRKKKKKD